MTSRDKDQTTPHLQPLLSSLVIRPSVSDSGEDGAGGGRVSDYEPGEVRREPPSYSRSDRYSDDPGSSLSLSLSLSLVFLNFRLFFTVKLIVQSYVYLLVLASSLLNDYLRS